MHTQHASHSRGIGRDKPMSPFAPASPTPNSYGTVGTPTPRKRYLPALTTFVDELDFAFGVHSAVFDRVHRNRR